MEDNDSDFNGKVIPEKYWNNLVEWRVAAPYDGCYWKMSHACVDGNGNFIPINSEGRDLNDWMEMIKSEHGLVPGYKGLFDHSAGWDERRMTAIAAKYGFTSEDNAQYVIMGKEYEVWAAVFGKDWQLVSIDKRRSDPAVIEQMKPYTDRFAAYKKEMGDFYELRQDRRNAMFMGAVLDNKPEDLAMYPIDDKSLKRTCERFCTSYASDVGMMCGVLDAMVRLGYDCWCKCSDCGEMFQPQDYDKFSDLIDGESYHGDGGIGMIFTRVLCEDCHDDVQCPSCNEPTLPNSRDKSVKGHEYDHTSYHERFLMKWLGICEYCADGFFTGKDKHWRDDVDDLETMVDDGIAKLKEYLKVMKEAGRTDDELKKLESANMLAMSKDWMEATNNLRARMQSDVEDCFGDDDLDFEGRVSESDNYDYT